MTERQSQQAGPPRRHWKRRSLAAVALIVVGLGWTASLFGLPGLRLSSPDLSPGDKDVSIEMAGSRYIDWIVSGQLDSAEEYTDLTYAARLAGVSETDAVLELSRCLVWSDADYSTSANDVTPFAGVIEVSTTRRELQLAVSYEEYPTARGPGERWYVTLDGTCGEK